MTQPITLELTAAQRDVLDALIAHIEQRLSLLEGEPVTLEVDDVAQMAFRRLAEDFGVEWPEGEPDKTQE